MRGELVVRIPYMKELTRLPLFGALCRWSYRFPHASDHMWVLMIKDSTEIGPLEGKMGEQFLDEVVGKTENDVTWPVFMWSRCVPC